MLITAQQASNAAELTFKSFFYSPGFGGAAALAGGALALFGQHLASKRTLTGTRETLKQSDTHHEDERSDVEETKALERCWTRFTWLVDRTMPTADSQARLFPIEVVLELTDRLADDAETYGDATLRDAIREFAQVVGEELATTDRST